MFQRIKENKKELTILVIGGLSIFFLNPVYCILIWFIAFIIEIIKDVIKDNNYYKKNI